MFDARSPVDAMRDEGIRERLFWVKVQRWADKMKVHLSRLCRSSVYFWNVPNSDIPQTLMSRHPNSTPMTYYALG